MKKKITELSEKDRIQTLDMLYTAASSIRGQDAMKLFLRDLLTTSERVMLGRRVLIARLLLAGASQVEICRKLKVGSNTVWRVQKWLEEQFPDYKQARQGKGDSFSYAALKKKYPLHFLLFPEPKPKPKKK